ncbi:SDR family oxidoreductase [Adhaeribacter pallidiroseus]|uniref:Versicolorin reductase n=1 Tax=Adhaeribacter pallidiroseus TaxID=2072847 RepID=A0A369QF39_9BACT|nr:SDR family NAD(P)-dependent oxidoreductase [Adhaeribacter pallidiroseus]RDC63523.1 Versicolorin reductase [Adhaeribacter pallidiroseus]
MNLKGATILITGGTLGIGYATAKLLAACGAQVAITGRNPETVQKAAAEIGAFGITADVANPEDVKRTYQEFLQQFGHLDCLINNAGIGEFKTIDQVSLENFQRVYETNVFGAAFMASEAAQLFMAQNHGNIINIASTAGTKGFAGGSVYASSKFALRGMTQCWQAELRKFNVRVMLINPSEVTTAFNQPDRQERSEEDKKLRGQEIAMAIKGALELDDRGFIPELTVWATNPF